MIRLIGKRDSWIFSAFPSFLEGMRLGAVALNPFFSFLAIKGGKTHAADTKDALGGPGSPSDKLGTAGAVLFVCFVEHFIYSFL